MRRPGDTFRLSNNASVIIGKRKYCGKPANKSKEMRLGTDFFSPLKAHFYVLFYGSPGCAAFPAVQSSLLR